MAHAALALALAHATLTLALAALTLLAALLPAKTLLTRPIRWLIGHMEISSDCVSHPPIGWKLIELGFVPDAKLRLLRSQSFRKQLAMEWRMPDLTARKIAYMGYTGPIDSEGVGRIAAALNNAVNDRFDEVQLSFSSLGGYVSDGIYLYNHIRGLPLNTVIHNTGSVSSIAVAVFVAGGERYCSPHAMFMIHPTVMPSQEGMTSERLQSSLNAALADDARTENILRDRAAIPGEILVARRFKDVYITPKEAVIYGLVHAVKDFVLPQGSKIIQI